MPKYLAPIDPHVHLRGTEYPDHNFLEIGFKNAKAVGLSAVLEQPNPTPNLTTVDNIVTRKEYATAYRGHVKHNVHIGMTTNETQIRNALSALTKRQNDLISDKIFYVHSTGDMGLLDPELQKKIWEIKWETGYDGVSIGHFEDESEFSDLEFDPENPLTHSLKQNRGSETTQVERQIENAKNANFKGTFYIAHCSNPETIDFIESERPHLPFEVVVEATFHHLFLNTTDYDIHKNGVKMNPPLRMPKHQESLLEHALAGRIQIIGTDHAPHPLEKKKSDSPPSGIPALPFWPKGIELLRKNGMSQELLDNMTFHTANRLFNLGLSPKKVEIEYKPSLWESYGYNPFSRVDGRS